MSYQEIPSIECGEHASARIHGKWGNPRSQLFIASRGRTSEWSDPELLSDIRQSLYEAARVTLRRYRKQ